MKRAQTARVPSPRKPDNGVAPPTTMLQQSLGNRGMAQLLRTPAATAPAAPATAPATGGRRVYATIEVVGHGEHGDVYEPLTGERDDGRIEITEFHMGGSSPTDAHSGGAAGARRYRAATLKKAIDGASPLLMRAFSENQALRVTLHFTRPGADAAESTYQTIVLTGARLSGFDQSMADGGDSEELTITYQSIEMTSAFQGRTQTDSTSNAR